MSQPEIIKKAQDLLRLRDRAGTPGEAEAAARALNKLIDKHRLTMAELESSGQQQVEQCVLDFEKPILEWQRLAPHKRDLCSVLCEHYGVAWWQQSKCVGVNRGHRTVKKRAIYMCGRASDIAIVRYMFSWLLPEIERLAAAFGGDRVSRKSFRLGFVAGIYHQLKESRQELGSKSMVLRNRYTEAEEALKKFVPDLVAVPIRPTDDIDANAYLQGVDGGRSIHLGEKIEKATRATT